MYLEKSHRQAQCLSIPSYLHELFRGTSNTLYEAASHIAYKVGDPAGRRAGSMRATSAPAPRKRAEHATSTRVSGEQTIKELKAKEVRMGSSATNNGV